MNKTILLVFALVIPTLTFSQDFEGWYRLKTMFRGENECLEGNEAGSSVHGGAAFMDKCKNVSGQLWKIEKATNPPAETPKFNGWYRLRTQFRGKSESLEGNQASSKTHNGAAFMAKKQYVTGQLRNIVPANDGYYRLKTQFRGENECLECNQASSSAHNGGAFMDKCQNVSGQLWKIVDAGNGYYRLKTMFRGENECLEGNQAGSSTHGGAAFMDKCQNVSGQLWKIEEVKKLGTSQPKNRLGK